MSAPSVGLTSAQLFTRARSPRAAFEAHDPEKTGKVSLDGARAAFSALGVKLNFTETKSLLLKQAGGDRGVPSANLELDYAEFLKAAGADTPRSSGERPSVPVPEQAADVAANMAGRLVRERGGLAAEGYKNMLNDKSQLSVSRKKMSSKREVRVKDGARMGRTGRKRDGRTGGGGRCCSTPRVYKIRHHHHPESFPHPSSVCAREGGRRRQLH